MWVDDFREICRRFERLDELTHKGIILLRDPIRVFARVVVD